MKFDYAATTPLVTETLGSDFVGMESSGAEFLPALHKKKIKKPPRGQSDPDYKSSIRGRLLRSRKPRREIAAVEFPSDDDSFNEPRRFNVEDILIEARRKDGRVMLFCLWSDFEPVDASWVLATDLNAGLRDWWSGERELRYALYREGDFVSYENCLAYLHDNVPKQLPSFLDSKEGDYARGTPLRVVDSRGRVKLILFSSSSSDVDSGSDSKLLYHGERAYYVKEILDDRIYDSTKEYLILWDGYDTPTWVPEENVNDVAIDVYNRRRRMAE